MIETRLRDFLENEAQHLVQKGENKQVPDHESFTVRVVSSRDARLDMNEYILEAVGEGYPAIFPYRSRVIMLFQTVDGVDIAIFGFYCHEFWEDAELPNRVQSNVYYVDSVKYLQSTVQISSIGMSFRSAFYHEILIGYIQFLKEHGFTSVQIWPNPAVKEEGKEPDYIFNGHPNDQPYPEFSLLKSWYLRMLEKARNERFVLNITDVYKKYFISYIKMRGAVALAEVPHFKEDSWVRLALEYETPLMENIEDLMDNMSLERNQAIIAELQEYCTRCSSATMALQCCYADLPRAKVSLRRLFTKRRMFRIRKRFMRRPLVFRQEFGRPYRIVIRKRRVDKRNGHRHSNFEEREIVPLISNKDVEDNLENIFNPRERFLHICRYNMYQFDSLLKAKHSTMMVLYLLFNPSAPKCYHDRYWNA